MTCVITTFLVTSGGGIWLILSGCLNDIALLSRLALLVAAAGPLLIGPPPLRPLKSLPVLRLRPALLDLDFCATIDSRLWFSRNMISQLRNVVGAE
jgi:hypothetical protein